MIKKIEKVEIEWYDSVGNTERVWWWIDEYLEQEKKSLETFKSTGYLIYQDKKKTILATSLHFGDKGQFEKAGSIFTIPTGCIIKKTFLKR